MGIFLGILVFILSFLPFHMLSSPLEKHISFIRLRPDEFIVQKGVEGGTLRYTLNGDPKTLNPAVAQETTSTAVVGDLFTGLTRIDLKTMEPVPDLAQSWEVYEEGRRYVFHLRKDVRWSDGEPFSADDVVFTYRDVYLNEKIPNSTMDMLRGVLKTPEDIRNFVRKLDDYTVEFRLPSPFAPFLGVLSSPILPKHKLEKYVKDGNFMSAWNVNTDPKDLVGTGPYVIERYIKGQVVEYTANPYYYMKPLPYIKHKVAYIVQDPDTALIKFSQGAVDYVGIRPQDLNQVTSLKGINLYDLGTTPAINFLVFNQNPKAKIPPYKLKWFQNRDFRVALSHAIDREGICYLVYNGLAEPLYGPITPANRPYYEEGLFPKYEYDLKKARSMLEKLGFKDRDGDGILEDNQGHKLEIVILTNAGNREREMIGNMIKEDFEKIGVKVIFRSIDFNTLVSKLTSPPYDWEAVIIGLTGSMDPYFGRNVWHSSGTLHVWNPMQKSPTTQWEQQVDKLIDDAARELDFKKRLELYREAFRIIAWQQPMLFIAAPKSMLASYPKFGNFFPTVWGWYQEEHMFITRLAP
ncbi:ABC transporter substrate-binding protein [Thermocrinis minervae]|uniref:Peptide/nickel transport system substrate-binding protein n=1 Tax=Thermocrinis minervae TaxID=381751 RepID=A0A1M6QZD5_9AQUI|nr:ABC transporter substrate-binding protein [Thermocrinis minervae]SHK25585.1 peptide/nickel transport system substrate-binding protein [Thermocrinis minervae]